MRIKNNFALTKRDMDILNILWHSSNPMTAAEITSAKEGLTINTVQAVLRKLLKQELIEVADIVYSGTVLCRNYRASVSAEEVTLSRFINEIRQFSEKISVSSFAAALLDTETDKKMRAKEIQNLERLLEDYKKDLEL